jgi:hypothetical protein
MNQDAISWAMQQGAPISCATCRFFHEGKMHCNKSDCGGPASGRDFPCYEGPIPREKFVERCLICGTGETAFHIVLGEGKTKFALCMKHRKIFNHVGTTEGSVQLPVRLIAVT